MDSDQPQIEVKTCTKCGQTKAIDEYAWRRDRQCYRNVCKACNAPRHREASKRHYVNTRHTETYQKTLKRNRKWHDVHFAEYYERNRERILAKNRVKDAERMKTDIDYRIKKRARSRVTEALRSAGAAKRDRALHLVGCTVFELRAYIEDQFVEGMTWEKFGYGPGTFQIDHIIPIAMFDLEDPHQQRQAFHYTNLQPLWWEDHQIKNVTDNARIRDRKRLLSTL